MSELRGRSVGVVSKGGGLQAHFRPATPWAALSGRHASWDRGTRVPPMCRSVVHACQCGCYGHATARLHGCGGVTRPRARRLLPW
jgi:hypothetical protein